MGARPAIRPLQPVPGVRHEPHDDAVELVLYHDVFCSWCYVADQRLDQLRAEYGRALSWSLKGFPLRPEDRVPDRRQRALLARHFRRVAKEAEGRGVKADLWTGRDPPASSMPPLVALEAALRQGRDEQRELLTAMRRAAFVDGINVARRDVVLELAARAGLDVPDFLERFDDPRSEGLVEAGYEEAEALGIKGVPALVIGGEWLMQGARELSEYRQVIDKYLVERSSGGQLRVLH
jgi:predicted DsbA family dithiol-disulfide isomerase